MRAKLGCSAATIAMIGATLIGTAGTASAAHCADDGRPGNAGFASHVKATNGPGGHNEGDHKGWSSCQETSANYVETP
jgi:hypothetical protein